MTTTCLRLATRWRHAIDGGRGLVGSPRAPPPWGRSPPSRSVTTRRRGRWNSGHRATQRSRPRAGALMRRPYVSICTCRCAVCVCVCTHVYHASDAQDPLALRDGCPGPIARARARPSPRQIVLRGSGSEAWRGAIRSQVIGARAGASHSPSTARSAPDFGKCTCALRSPCWRPERGALGPKALQARKAPFGPTACTKKGHAANARRATRTARARSLGRREATRGTAKRDPTHGPWP